MATVSATGTGPGSTTIAPHQQSTIESYSKQGGFVDYSIDIDISNGMDPVPSTSGGGVDQDVNKESSVKGKERETSHERDDGSDSDDQKYVILYLSVIESGLGLMFRKRRRRRASSDGEGEGGSQRVQLACFWCRSKRVRCSGTKPVCEVSRLEYEYESKGRECFSTRGSESEGEDPG